jgi:hypothetical protein
MDLRGTKFLISLKFYALRIKAHRLYGSSVYTGLKPKFY